MADFAQQRANMVDSQVRPSDVTDRRIPRAMLDVPRELYVPAAKRAIAYMDDPIVVGETQGTARHLMAPRQLAKLLQHMDVGADAAVLDVGAATGYAAAVLARMARSVVALEVDPALAERAASTLRQAGTANVTVETGLLTAGLPSRAPYDAILVEGGLIDVPAALLDQLKDGGRLVAVRVRNGVGKATLWRRYAMQFDHRELFDASAIILPGFEKPAGFVL